MSQTAAMRYTIGGIERAQPFKIRRLGHIGLDLGNHDEGVAFYTQLLGFTISDEYDFALIAPEPEQLAGLGPSTGYFTRHGSDHHSLLLLPKRVMHAVSPARWSKQNGTINQISWQVGTLQEVVDAAEYLGSHDVEVYRVGRDMPGSNWHAYIADPDRHTNEIFYGMEQIGWSRTSKPFTMEGRRLQEIPQLPLPSEADEVAAALQSGLDLDGYRPVAQSCTYDVGGVLLPRPFKIASIGPVGLFVDDVDQTSRFYEDRMGFIRTDTRNWNGHHCTFLRCGTEHHSLALYPVDLRRDLFEDDDTLMSFGLQVGSYEQLRAAAAFLRDRSVDVIDVPQELHPGVDHAVYVTDPDGHRLMLFFAMDQVGWDGRPRPDTKDWILPRDPSEWPATLPGSSGNYDGAQFMGPIG